MTTFFQLARVRRVPSPSPDPGWTIEVPEAARTVLENLIDPLVIVSYFGCGRSVQDTLFTFFEKLHGQDRTNKDSTSNPGGIWAWLPTLSTDHIHNRGTQTLYLIYREDEHTKEPLEPEDQVKRGFKHDIASAHSHPHDDILLPLLALCSTQLHVISTTASDTAADLTRIARSLQIFVTQQQWQRVKQLNLATLIWRWCDSTSDSESVTSSNKHEYDYSALASLQAIIEDIENNTDGTTQDLVQNSAHLDVLRQCFRDIECHLPSAPSLISRSTREYRGMDAAMPKQQNAGEKQDIDQVLTQVLQDLSLADESGSRDIYVDSTWLRDILSRNGTSNMDIIPYNAQYHNGPALYAQLQACATQLNTYPTFFCILELRRSFQDLIRNRASHYGVQAYHRIMNEHLDRQPIPISWHTLAMFHHDALSKSLDEIEKRYYGPECQLPSLLQEFRVRCLETAAITGESTDSGAGAANVTDTVSVLEMMVPTKGLYLEYYSANASALQNHHLISLDEHWQTLLKSRLMATQTNSGAMAPATLSQSGLVPLRSAPDIKDYSGFLLAVDQVRRSYLETCIPSPEAISVLESLDEMQQAESTVFLQSITSVSPSTTSPAPLPTHLKRSGSISSSRQSVALTNINVSSGGGDVLTDTLNNKRSSIQAVSTASGGGVGTSSQASQQMDQTPTELEQQIAEIMQAKRRVKSGAQYGSFSVEASGAVGQRDAFTRTGKGKEGTGKGNESSALAASESAAVQFGWTLHMLHANTLQYAWIWTWLYMHEGSSRQNVVACDSKMYTASKWIVLPAKDLIRTRKDWKISYGDRVCIVSYWFSTRNAKTDLPEYLPRARGAPCRHVVPYGETYVICKTCPADVLCMRCFRASDHVDHVMYLQCSWGTSVCVCGDALKASHALHCSLHSAEIQRSYSQLAKGKPCQIKFKAGEKVYRCKSCATVKNGGAVLCDRCFRSHNHFGHDVVAQAAQDGMMCSCHDDKSWDPNLHCAYHSPGILEPEYHPRPLAILPPMNLIPNSSSQNGGHDDKASQVPAVVPAQPPHRCGHVFRHGEDIYHCRDCSFNEKVVLCSRCFHNSGCVNHRWQMGVFQDPTIEAGTGSSSIKSKGEKSVFHGQASPSVVVDDLAIADQTSVPTTPSTDADATNPSATETNRASCDCGDPTLFKTAFDCNYHLLQAFRPVPDLVHCGYLFQKGETMLRCRTCHIIEETGLAEDSEKMSANGPGEKRVDSVVSDIWICGRCFDMEEHHGHTVEEVVNGENQGLYCHCGDPTIFRDQAMASAVASSNGVGCKDDHNRQNVLCTTEIKEGMDYYKCKTCHTNPKRIFCEACFIKEAHEGHSYERLTAEVDFEVTRCSCGENSAFRFATHCQQHERAGGSNIVLRCHYRATAGEWVALCSDCYPAKDGMPPSYLCLRCRQASDHKDHKIKWMKADTDMPYPCACGSHSLSRLSSPNGSSPENPSQTATTSGSESSSSPEIGTIHPPPLCQYHTMIYKTTPSTTLFLHSHNHRSVNHQNHNEVSGYKYHDSNNDWIISRPDMGNGSSRMPSSAQLSPYLQWKDVFWLKHVNTGKYFNSMASRKISQGFQEVSALGGPHSNNDWIVEETTWLRQQILSDE